MSFSVVFSFFLLAAPAFFSPGPNNLMLMTSAAKFGVRRTAPHLLGIVLGFPIMVFVVGVGLGELFTAFPIVKMVMKYLAIAYFLWMAWHLLGLKLGAASAAERPLKVVEAALFQWINPKAWAMAISFVAAFVVVGEYRFASIVLLSLGCFFLGPFSALTWAVFGKQLHNLMRRTGTERYLGAVLAALMVGAVVLFLL